MTIVFLIAGIVLLTLGAEMLIRSASALAAAAGISPLVIGLTVVAYGTSAPELVVCLQAAFSGQSDIAIGNAVGSNILNVLLILGISALITPLFVAQQFVRIDVPLMIGLSVLLLLLSLDGSIGRWDGSLLVCILVTYNLWSIIQSRKEQQAIREQYAQVYGAAAPVTSLVRAALLVVWGVLGLGLLVLGSRWFTDSASGIARDLGVSELIIGLTIVAAGTSLPEIATSVLAAIRGERDIAVGNVVGSNIFNIICVLGLSGVAAPAGIAVSPTAMAFDIPVMIAVAVACLPIFLTGHRIARWEGGLFLGYYIAYTTYLVLAASRAAAVGTFGTLMLTFVIPLTIITLGIGVWRSLSERRKPAPASRGDDAGAAESCATYSRACSEGE